MLQRIWEYVIWKSTFQMYHVKSLCYIVLLSKTQWLILNLLPLQNFSPQMGYVDHSKSSGPAVPGPMVWMLRSWSRRTITAKYKKLSVFICSRVAQTNKDDLMTYFSSSSTGSYGSSWSSWISWLLSKCSLINYVVTIFMLFNYHNAAIFLLLHTPDTASTKKKIWC